ncbi:hypothetical protein LTR72_012352, partial [Exophiala xenobiotica]
GDGCARFPPFLAWTVSATRLLKAGLTTGRRATLRSLPPPATARSVAPLLRVPVSGRVAWR